MNKYLKEDFDKETIQSAKELSEIILSGRTQYIRTVARVYLNFLEENEILSDDDANYFRKAIPSRKTSPDGFIPSDEKVKEVLRKIDNPSMKTAFLVLATSGIRIMELVKMIKEFDKDKLIVNHKIAKYPLNYFRGHKKVFYVYMPKNLTLSLERTDFNDDAISNYFSELGLSPKYLRKWQYNFLIYQGVPEGVADFIQGRSSESVGSMHYLSKVKQADYWYSNAVAGLSGFFRNVQHSMPLHHTQHFHEP
ncbi:MAG: integrase [Thermoplasmataceae archaeon]